MSSVNNVIGGAKYPPRMSSTEEGEFDDRTTASEELIRKMHKRVLERLNIPEGRQRIDILQLNLMLDIKMLLEKLASRLPFDERIAS